ncbi:diguanylate cyclase [Marinicella litoralis]|uniref:diguanylate cyclase n=1 Tax=Marinicella litoralis TaxID=644220 RepID=A0A4R6XDP0_9GAMM|nr:diguanylate cyclase [Marinicella litoralis]TDR17435.1 diguanylate cyclase (GGDEF)-like protein [Marinicella litoralis]
MTPNTNHYLSWIDVDNELHCEVLLPSKKKITIGRSEQADVEVLNTSVSRQHLELSWHDEGLQVKDLNSSYGTWIDSVKLPANEYKTLVADSEMKLGNLSMWYELRRDNESQEMFQTCFHPPTVNDEIELSSEFNDFRVKLLFLLQENFGDNTLNVQLIRSIDDELYQLINSQELRLKEQRILNSISHILNRSLTLSELLKTALNLVSKVLNAERGFVVIKDTNVDQHRILALRHFDQLNWNCNNKTTHDFSHALVEKCFDQNKILIIGDTELNEALDDINPVKQGGGRSVVVIPLVQENLVIGVIYLDNQQKSHNFNQQQIPFLTTFAAHTSIALHNTLLYKRAITDDLTQLFTRQHVDEVLAQEIIRAQRYQQPLSLLILDLDHFKRINDSYGHTTGDQVLQKFSAVIKQHVRECDLAGRFGGEEFIVILPDTDLVGAHAFAERIRKATAKMVIVKGNQNIKVTVSIGAASYQAQHEENALLLLEDADKALYQAKEQGRNRTVSYSGQHLN